MSREPVIVESQPPARDAQHLAAIGLGADAGVPDGLMGSLVLRPAPFVRLQLGAGSNSASPGVRLGATAIPLGWGPSLTLEGGHYLAGDASTFVQTVFGGLGRFATYVGKVDYSFVNAHLGWEVGRENFTFFIHGGLTYMRATLSQLVVPPDTSSVSSGGTVTTLTFHEDPIVRMYSPSVKLGLVVYLQ